MLLGQELLILKIADEITAAQLVADAQEHPLLPQLEHVGAGNILVSSNSELFLIKVRMEQLADVVPVLEVFGLHDYRRFLVATAVHSIVDPIVDPDIGIEVRHISHELAVLIPWGHFMRLSPLIQVVVEGVGNPVPIGSLTMIDHSWPAVFGDKTGATEHTVPHGCRSQHSGVPLPVYHVFAGNMGEDKTSTVPVNVVQVVTPLPEEGWVGVARYCVSRPEMGEVVSQPGFWQALWYGRSLDDRLRLLSTAHGGDEAKSE